MRGHLVVIGVCRMNEVNTRQAWLVLGWVVVFGWYATSQLGQLQPCIPPGSLNRLPASACVKVTGGNVTSAGWQVTLCDPIWHVSSRSGVAVLHCELLYPYTLLYLLSLPIRTQSMSCALITSICVFVVGQLWNE